MIKKPSSGILLHAAGKKLDKVVLETKIRQNEKCHPSLCYNREPMN
jgi:hypothetical protein